MGDEYRRFGIAGALQQIEMSKARGAGKVTVTLAPDLDELGLMCPGAKPIYGEKDGCRAPDNSDI
jgi:hypothetical protein